MLFKDIAILAPDYSVQRGMYVGTEGSKIAYVGDKMPEKDYGEVYDGRNRLLMPGFVNSHAHSPMTLMRGYGENMVLQDWLNKLIFPFEAKLDSNAVYWGTMLAMAESIRFGIVSTSDMYYFCEDMVRAIDESGEKANVSRSITCFDDSDLFDLQGAKEMKSFFENYHGAAGGRILVDMSLHAEYTSNEKIARQLAEYTKSVGANMHVHASETKSEVEACKERHGGLTPVQYMNACGLFDTRSTAAHCVWLEDDDYRILREKGVTVATNPISNLKLASGVCNTPRLLKEGVNVAIGTDSVSSNNSLNFIEEMKAMACAPKAFYGDPAAITPVEVLRAATRGGALAQGRDDCGYIAEGARADITVLDIGKPYMYPVHNLLTNVVYSAAGTDVALTMVDGRVLYKDGEYMTVDIEKTVAEVTAATDKILGML